MKIVAIQASPRKKGNSDRLMDKMIEGAIEEGNTIEKFYLDDMNIKPCQACLYCGKEGKCRYEDDEEKIINALLDADGLIFASPIYYGQFTAQFKLFIDRTYSVALNPNKSFKGKAALIVTHAAPKGYYDDFLEYVKWAPFEVMDFNVFELLDVGSVSNKSDVEKQEDVLNLAYEIGKKF